MPWTYDANKSKFLTAPQTQKFLVSVTANCVINKSFKTCNPKPKRLESLAPPISTVGTPHLTLYQFA